MSVAGGTLRTALHVLSPGSDILKVFASPHRDAHGKEAGLDASIALAAAYLQMNGFFVLTELPVQVAERSGYRTATDVDVLAVRLPHAAELVPAASSRAHDLMLGQDPLLENDPSRIEVLLVEVKRGRGRMNAGYHDADVLRFALRRAGCCPPDSIEMHARDLAHTGEIETTATSGHACRVRLASIAGDTLSRGGRILCVGLDHCVAFIRERLARYEPQLRGAYFRDPVLNLLGLVDALTAASQTEKESVHAS